MNLVYWNQPQPTQDTKIKKFRILRAPERFGTYAEIKIVDPAFTGTNPFVWVLQYYDNEGLANHWYKVESTESDIDKVIAVSQPLKGEPTTSSVFDILWKLRAKLGDTTAVPCFQDYELLAYLNEALVMHNRTKTWETIDDTELVLVLWLTVANICLVLAQDSSKFYPLSIDGITVDKGNRVTHYGKMHDSYKARYDEKKEQWHLEAEGSGYIHESYMTRESYTTGRRTPYIHATKPKQPRLYVGERVSAGQIDLRWSVDHDPGFYYYIIFRSLTANAQKRLVEDTYHKRIALYDDPGDAASKLWGGVTLPVRMIFRNSVDLWMDQNRNNTNPFFSGPNPLLRAETKYYYIIGVVNKNILASWSNEICVQTTALGPPSVTTPLYDVTGIVTGEAEPTAIVTVEKSTTGASGPYTEVSNVTLKSGTLAAYYFEFGPGVLGVGNFIRVKQEFNGEESAYTTPEVVI